MAGLAGPVMPRKLEPQTVTESQKILVPRSHPWGCPRAITPSVLTGSVIQHWDYLWIRLWESPLLVLTSSHPAQDVCLCSKFA